MCRLLDGVPRRPDGRVAPHVTMCTFQETYDPVIYGKFMGTAIENPRSDFERRLRNFDRAADAGMRFANPGILVGLNRDLAYELLALLAHIHHLAARGMAVYISLPRLRKAVSRLPAWMPCALWLSTVTVKVKVHRPPSHLFRRRRKLPNRWTRKS